LVNDEASVRLVTLYPRLAEVATLSFQLFLPENFPLTAQASAWYADIGLVGILLMDAMALDAFHISLGDRLVFGSAMFEE
jgi:hypothetical protein